MLVCVCTCQNATLLEITCHSSNLFISVIHQLFSSLFSIFSLRVPAFKQEIVTLKPRSKFKEDSYKLNRYERVVQVRICHKFVCQLLGNLLLVWLPFH